MLTRLSLVRTAQVLCIGGALTLASTALATSASAATLPVGCSEAALRAAINTANGTPGSDTLNLAPGCTYGLTAELPAVTSPVVVNGNGATLTRTSGTFRILTVDGGNLTLRSAVLTNGNATGSSVQPGAGGGVVVTGNGSLTVTASVIRGNSANYGGGVSVFNGSQAQFTASTVSANTAANNGGGLVNDGTLVLNATQVSGNTAGNAGGGIANIGTLTLNASNLTNNTTPNGPGAGLANGVPGVSGGTSTVNVSNITNNTAGGTNPGGVYNNGGTVNLRISRVAANTPNNCLTSPTAVPGCIG
ncbi:hypothetical protein SAMN05216223_111120 [Actinacidiphila yanglinensis]|uniref:Polymorphic outer membrane protein repeat-containing protein n=1 Tax=Actinacidiphila yanglinensis TaxID=310779 RepID=A0A1H6D1Y3_9ACTN|nr:hypothetical protein [Actinacidiphila yanglinensis]SEG79247.1 hypothetical protein SAMN05216223_111120 [Actinacidiphila yanglinensis]